MTAIVPMRPLSRTYTEGETGATYVVAGPRGYLRADCTRLPSGHAHLDAWVMRSDTGDSDALTRRACEPLEAAWDRGGGSALFVALEAKYRALLEPPPPAVECPCCLSRVLALTPRGICHLCAAFPLD